LSRLLARKKKTFKEVDKQSKPSICITQCKDYNFIRLSGLAARAFRLPGQIAHGNHIGALTLQQIMDRKDIELLGYGPTSVEVSFRRPVVVSSALDVQVLMNTAKKFEYDILMKGKICVKVIMKPLQHSQHSQTSLASHDFRTIS
jgi:hypothetical protein